MLQIKNLTERQAEEVDAWYRDLMKVHTDHIIHSGLVPVPGVHTDMVWATQCESCDNQVIGKALISVEKAMELLLQP